MAANIIRFFGLLLVALLVGTMFGIWLAFNPSGLSAATYIESQQHTIRALNTVLPALGGVCIVLTVLLAILSKNDARCRYLLVGAVMCLVVAGSYHAAANQPINGEVLTWNPVAPAADWMELRDTWWRWRVVRTVAGIGALVLSILAALRSRRHAP